MASLISSTGNPTHLLVRLVNVINGEDGKVAVIAEVAKRDSGSRLQRQLVDGGLVDIEGDGDAEECPISEAVFLDDSK